MGGKKEVLGLFFGNRQFARKKGDADRGALAKVRVFVKEVRGVPLGTRPRARSSGFSNGSREPFERDPRESRSLGRTPSYAVHRTVAKGRQGRRVFPPERWKGSSPPSCRDGENPRGDERHIPSAPSPGKPACRRSSAPSPPPLATIAEDADPIRGSPWLQGEKKG